MKKLLGALYVNRAAKKEMLFFMSAVAFQGGIFYKAAEEASANEKAFRALPIQEQAEIGNRNPAMNARTSCDFFGALAYHMSFIDLSSDEQSRLSAK